MSWRRVLIAGLTALLVLLGAAAWAAKRALEPAAAAGSEPTPVVFVVSPGETLGAIAARLEDAGLVRNRHAVEWLARWHDLGASLQTGEFRLTASQSPEEILREIVEGRVVTYEVVLPPGFTLAQIAERLGQADLVEEEAFLALSRNPQTARSLGVEGDSLEGYLFPETYRIPKGLPTLAVAGVLVRQFLQIWQEIAPKAKQIDFSMKDVVTLASIVEKETGDPRERPLIASVFHNRLARGMRLETDPTVIYGIADFNGNLRRRDLENEDNPYNTYKIYGLPPGPIASPGAESLRAVVDPAKSEYIFFVSRNDGTHVFSRSYREHVNAVNRYQKRDGG